MRPTMMPRRGTVSTPPPASTSKNGAAPPALARATSTGQVPVPKHRAAFQAILRGGTGSAGSTEDADRAKDPERFYFDLFCLAVDRSFLANLVEAVPTSALIESGSTKNNVRELFFFAVKCLKTSEGDDLRLDNVVEILHIILRSFLSHALPNYNFDVMNLLAGSLDQADIVLADFVTGIDGILQNQACSVHLKERVLALALLVVTSINQGSINSYFLRRDLFTSITKLVADAATAHLAADSFLVLGILANYHKYETRNAMLVRFEDLVDETIMKRVREAAALALQQARDAFLQVMDDTPPSFVMQVTSLVSSLKYLASPLSPPRVVKTETTGSPSAATPAKEESAYVDLPSEIVAFLLPIYDLINANKAFSSFLLHDRANATSQESDILASLISFSSYLGTHAAVGRRAQLYSRLTYTILLILVEEGGPSVFMPAEQGSSIRICRQRQPTLQYAGDKQRPLMCGVLDSVVQFLRFNITRARFDTATYILTLRLLHKSMHQLKTARCRLDYDWHPVHQALLSLAQFLVTRHVELSDLPGIDDLVTQVFVTLDFAIIWADVILPDVDAIARLYYELLRSDNTISKLGNLAAPPPSLTIPPPSPRLGPGSPSMRRHDSSGHNTPKSPGLQATPSTSSFGPPEPSGPAEQSIRNLAVVRGHLGEKVEDFKEKSGSPIVEAHQVLAIIKSSMDGMDLRESMALEDMGMKRYSEAEHHAFFAELVPIICQDVLKMANTELSPGRPR